MPVYCVSWACERWWWTSATRLRTEQMTTVLKLRPSCLHQTGRFATVPRRRNASCPPLHPNMNPSWTGASSTSPSRGARAWIFYKRVHTRVILEHTNRLFISSTMDILARSLGMNLSKTRQICSCSTHRTEEILSNAFWKLARSVPATVLESRCGTRATMS